MGEDGGGEPVAKGVGVGEVVGGVRVLRGLITVVRPAELLLRAVLFIIIIIVVVFLGLGGWVVLSFQHDKPP